MQEHMMGGMSTIVGTFDDSDQAEQALLELRRMGFREDQIDFSMSGTSTMAGSFASDEEPVVDSSESSTATVVVRAGERHQEVTDLFHRFGALDVRGAGEQAPVFGSPGNLRDFGSPGNRSVGEGSLGSSYDATRDTTRIDDTTPKRVTDATTYNVDMEGSGQVRTGESSGAPVDDPSRRDRWEDESPHFRSRWEQSYGAAGRRWEDYEPAYRFGWERSRMPGYQGRQWSEAEPELRRDWESQHHQSPWDRIVDAVKDTWEHITGKDDRSDIDRAA